MPPILLGLHHLTAVTAQAGRNYDFYTQTLGMRLVKKSVNQDDVSAYHLFYADEIASPGHDLTFFDWPHTPPEQRGRHSITEVGLRVDSAASLAWWQQRFAALGVSHQAPAAGDGRPMLLFEDFEGQRLALVAAEPPAAIFPWSRSPIPAQHQIRGLGPVTMTVARLEPTALFLTRVLGMRELRHFAHPQKADAAVHVFGMAGAGSADPGPAAELHVAVRPDLPPARPGAGGVHHVAFRVPDTAEHQAWQRHFDQMGVNTSGIIDRYYFQSIYVREPNGVLFELATDGPGFTVDEPLETLGERLALPPFLEPRRAAIEAGLRPLT
ncbi:MAG: ring-cleaving dioxygenase [Caldilineales bacterium]|nr:ring-cleaving dioxygenase [Caldilineales bacterium]